MNRTKVFWLLGTFFLLLAASTTSLMAGTYSGGDGTESSPYQIANLADLSELCQTPGDWGAHFVQTSNIDASQTQYWDDTDDNGDGNPYNDDNDATSVGNNDGFSPIGNYTTRFTGHYDGGKQTISGLTINRPGTDYIGLFGFANGATIKNVTLTTVNITARSTVGALAGKNGDNLPNSTIQGCSSSGNVSGYNDVGGLVGINTYATISSSHSSVTVTGSNSHAGGLVGSNYYDAIISGSTSTGTVSGHDGVGGLVGANTYHNPQITHCHSTGNVSGTSNVGGLAGWSDSGPIQDSYATGDVSSTGWTAGGFIGYNKSEAGTSIERCYATGNASGYGQVGGFAGRSDNIISNCYSRGNASRTGSSSSGAIGAFCGYNTSTIEYAYSTGDVTYQSSTPSDKGFVGSSGSSTTYTANFWDAEASNQATATGATGKNTTEMKTHTTFTAAGWDFVGETANGTNDYWDMDYSGAINDGYPYLSWQDGDDTSLPVELTLFTAQVQEQAIVLQWSTASEVNNLGFILERSDDGQVTWKALASYKTDSTLKGQGNKSSRTDYRFVDLNVNSGNKYSYRLSSVNWAGESTICRVLSIKFTNEQRQKIPLRTELLKAYPNPFNPKTCIRYRLAKETDVKIAVLDIMGQTVKALFSGHQAAGSYRLFWDGTNNRGAKVATGNYLIRMQTGDVIQIQKVMLVK